LHACNERRDRENAHKFKRARQSSISKSRARRLGGQASARIGDADPTFAEWRLSIFCWASTHLRLAIIGGNRALLVRECACKFFFMPLDCHSSLSDTAGMKVDAELLGLE
jgi:hypothetical protein